MEDQKNNQEMEAKVKGRDLQISTKQSVEVCNFIRNKNVSKVKAMLNLALEKKMAIPYKRFHRDTGHKPGIGSGRYPEKTIRAILKLLNSAEKNAENKNMDVNKLVVSFASANQGPKAWHFGRKRRRQMKSTHVELRVREKK